MSEAFCVDVEARWFAGKGRSVASVTPAGLLGPLRLADVAYADGGAERYLLTPEEPVAWVELLRSLAAGAAVSGAAGRLELTRGRAFDALLAPALAAGAPPPSTPSLDQTNTLVVLGGRLLVKAYRRLEPGLHPEVELLTALDRVPDAPVPAFAGALSLVPDDGGEPTALALLQAFVPDAVTGWEPPIVELAAHLRRKSAAEYINTMHSAADLSPYREAGRATARLHAALAQALPTRPATPDDRARWHAEATKTLEEAASADPAFAASFDAIRQGLEPLRRRAAAGAAPVTLQRTHGDLHFAQFLRGADGEQQVIDFEGDPTRPLASRRALDTPLRDLASLLRSIDHIGSAASRRADWADPGAWIAAARAQTLAGYAEGRAAGSPRDADAAAAAAPPGASPLDLPLLHALELARECGEAVYAHRVLPEWAYVAPRGLARLLASDPTPDPTDPTP